MTQRGRLTLRQMTQNETTPLRHFLYFCGKDKDYYETQSI